MRKYLLLDKRQRIRKDNKEIFPTADVRIIEELNKKNIPYDFAYIDTLEFAFTDGETHILANRKNLKEYTHIILRGHNLENQRSYEIKRYIIDYAEENYIKVLNSNAIKFFPYYNKIALAQICSKYHIPYLNTYYRLDGDYTKERDFLNEYPLICKEYAGANRIQIIDGEKKIKKNVYKIDNKEGYNQEFLKDQDLKNFFIQEFSPAGMDIRIFVKNNKTIAGWKRYSRNNFNTVSEGKYEMYNNPKKDEKRLAERVARIFKANFIAVDLIPGKDKNLFVEEISLNPGFKAYETKIEGTPVNIAEAIITSF